MSKNKKSTNRTQRKIDRKLRIKKQLERIINVINGVDVEGPEPRWLPEVWYVYGKPYAEAMARKAEAKNIAKDIAPETSTLIPVELSQPFVVEANKTDVAV